MRSSRWLQVLRIILFIGLAGGVVYFIPFQKIVDAIRSASPFHFWMACLLGLPISYLGAVQLSMLTRKQGIQVTPFQLFEINLVVKFYSFFSPASAVGSLMRWYKLSGGGKSAEALTAVGVNRLFDIFVAIAFGAFWIAGDANNAILIQPEWIAFFLLTVLLLWIFATRYSHPILLWVRRLTEKSKWKWLQKAGIYMERLSASLLIYSTLNIQTIALMLVVGVTSELLGVIGYYYLAQSIGIPIHFTDLGWMRSLFFLVSLAPFTLAGGVGLREISIVWVLTAVGVNAELSTALSFLVYARSVVISLIGGLIELLSLRKTF